MNAAGQRVVGAPVIEGADGNIYPDAWWEVEEGSAKLILRADDRDLPKSAYPYRIDPIFTFGPLPPNDALNFWNSPFSPSDVGCGSIPTGH